MKPKLLIPLLLLLLFLGTIFLIQKKSSPSPSPVTSTEPAQKETNPSPEKPPQSLADLGQTPDWTKLDPYQESITKKDFTELLETVYVWDKNTTWKNLIQVGDSSCLIREKNSPDSSDFYELRFRNDSTSQENPPRYWRNKSQLPKLSSAKLAQPLLGLRIAIDAGHIGGDFAQMEERYFTIQDSTPVMEGEMTLQVAKLIQPALENLGASVTLVRNKNAPVTTLRPHDFIKAAEELFEKRQQPPVPEAIRKTAEKLFYRTAEIRARGQKVNQEIQPDLVLCLHFNAEAWGEPDNPTLTQNNHLHMILHGAYMDGEIAHDDERFQLIYKLLQRIHHEEKNLNRAVVKELAQQSSLPPYYYLPRKPAMKIDSNPYLWARNLLANRLYECPVIFIEPYVMNSQEVFDRVQLGDYQGTQLVHGKERKSIYREYADSVVQGLKNYYQQSRTP